LYSSPYDDIDEFKQIINLNNFKMKSISDFFYYLVVNGDKIDNIFPVLTKGKTIDLLNSVNDKYGELTISNICKELHNFSTTKTCNDIILNSQQVDIFNIDTFTINQQNNMDYTLNMFINNNRVF